MDYRNKRRKMGLTQDYVAKTLGISVYTWQLIERGITKTPKEETQKKIDKLFKKEAP